MNSVFSVVYKARGHADLTTTSNTTTTIASSSKKKMETPITFAEENKKSPTYNKKVYKGMYPITHSIPKNARVSTEILIH